MINFSNSLIDKMKTHKTLDLSAMAAYVIMMMSVELMHIEVKQWWEPLVSVPFNTMFYATLAWLLCATASCLPRAAARLLHAAAHIAAGFYAVSSAFLGVMFHRRWDAFTMQFLHETNRREASEFVRDYIFDWHTAAIVLCALLLIAAERAASRRPETHTPLLPRHTAMRTAAVTLMAVMLSHTLLFSTDCQRNYRWADRLRSPLKRNAAWHTWQSVLLYGESRGEFDRCAATLARYNERPQCNDGDNTDMVIIIGESFNRHMSSLYGYPLDTNPRLAARAARTTRQGEGGLWLFNNVSASDNGTTQNFKYFLSMASVNDTAAWCDKPLLPAVMKSCGYNVIYYSNQFVREETLGRWDASMGFINLPAIERHIIDHRNTRKYRYDMDLVRDYAARRRSLETQGRNLCLFSLYGQHHNAQERYPESMAAYGTSDIRDGQGDTMDGLSEAQRQDIAHYLNATLYNDLVTDSIISMFDSRSAIIIYFADHGEEIHNWRDRYGRSDLSHDSRKAMPQQLDVPFMIYLTAEYRRLHPHTEERIASATGRRFMTDDLPHVVCDLLNINTIYYNPRLSLINAAYDEPKRLRLQNGMSY